MEQWQGTSEEFLLKMGWKKIDGYKINIDNIEDYDDFNVLYVEDLEDFVTECEYWQGNDSYPESAGEDADYLVESCYEEYFDDQDNLWDEPVQERIRGE